MAILKRNFSRGAMNKDIEERLLPNGFYLDALNVDVINAEGSDAGTARNIKGNTIVGDLGNAAGAAAVNAKCMGVVTSDKENRIYWLVTSDNYDGIYEYDEDTDVTVRVLQSSTGQLNFNSNYYVTGINIIDGFLYWTDNLNEPRRVNISFAKTFTIDDSRMVEYMNVIVAPPLHAPSITMRTEPNQETNMEDKFLQFAVRYKYRDNQWSALSPFSAVAFVPGAYSFDYAAGNNEAMVNTQNEVDVTFGTGGVFVEEIQLVVRDTKSLNVSIVETFDKAQVSPNPIYNGPLASSMLISNSTYTFRFKNNRIYTVLTADQVTRLFDNVPVKAKSQEIIDRRLIYGNYTQFYDLLDSSGEKLLIDYEVGYLSEEVASGTAIQTFRSDRDYEVAIQYGEDYGRFTTALTPSDNDNTIYIPPTASVTGNSLQVSINSKAPVFATHYRMMIKESKKSYYNIFPILYYSEGVYRYFLINKSDKNKFEVGEYVIFKADNEGATLSNKKYKILEFESKPVDFLDGDEISGLYFKIKAEADEFPSSALSVTTCIGIGANSTQEMSFCDQGTQWAIEAGSAFASVDTPIFYGSGLGDLAISSGYTYSLDTDLRVRIEIDGSTGAANTYKYKIHSENPWTAFNQGWISQNVSISSGATNITLEDPLGSTVTAFTIQFGQLIGYTVGDYWIVNCRRVEPLLQWLTPNNNFGGVAISNLAGNAGFQINQGAIVRMTISETFGTEGQTEIVFSPSNKDYVNIEEWFFGSQAYNEFIHLDANGSDQGSSRVFFRRGNDYTMGSAGSGTLVNDVDQGGSANSTTMAYPVRMFVVGYGYKEDGGAFACDQNVITVNWSVSQLDNSLLCETEPLEVDDQIFHEIPRTFPISSNEHKVLWEYADYTTANGGASTRLGFAIPSTDIPSSTDIPHHFHVGDTVWVTSDTPANMPSGEYTILEIEDQYNIILDFAFPGSGPVTGGGVSLADIEQDQDFPTTPAIIKINNPGNPNSTYNGYAFGNGLESDRIRDDFNETELQYSPRASIVIDDYEEETKEAALCYSGIYKGDSSINRLNEFNLSKSNFKNLDRQFGSIQKIFARDTNLLVMQEDKISQILYGKNLLSDSAGGGIIASVPEVLGTQTAYAGEYGISFNPESFANWGNDIFWADERRGSVLKMTTGQIVDISEKGMKDYFRDLFKDNPRTQKLGVYDPYRHQYIIASNEDLSVPCILELSSDGHTYPATNPGLEEISLERPDFTVTSNTSWTVGIVYSSGTNWVTGYPTSGTGNWEVHLAIGDNRSGSSRTATITFTYCDGETATFVVTQSKGRRITVHPIRVHNGRFTKF